MKTANDYMIALTADERTPSVKAMVDIILLDAAKAIDEALETPTDDFDEQIRDAHQDGYDVGYEAGKDVGYDQGFEDGHTQGYEEAKESEA